MKQNKSFEFVNYALPLNQYFFTLGSSVAVQIILHYAVSAEADRLTVSLDEAFRQIAYLYARQPSLLPIAIKEEIEHIENYPEDADLYGAFYDDTFCPSEEIECLKDYAAGNPDFSELCDNWFKFYVAYSGATKFNLKYHRDFYQLAQNNAKYFPSGHQVPTSLPLDMILEYQDKNAREMALLAMYAAIRSIVGRKPVAATTRAFIHSRMFGARNATELEALTQDPKLNECIKEWEPTKHRRKFASLLDDLRGRHLVNYWGDVKTRRVYVSLITDDNAFCIAVADFIKSQKKKKRDVTQTILNLLDVQVK